MTLHDIVIGATYRLQAREVGNPLVVVEEVRSYYQARTLVYVYEAARDTRYPVDPRHLTRAE